MTALELVTQPTTEILDPLTGEVVDATDLDAVVQAFLRLEEHKAAVTAAWAQCRDVLAQATSGSTQTRRALTSGYEIKAEFGAALDFDPGALRRAAAKLPEKERERFLRVEKYAINLTEWKKVREAALPEGDPLLLLREAERKSTRPAKVTVKVR